jgi:Sulfatase
MTSIAESSQIQAGRPVPAQHPVRQDTSARLAASPRLQLCLATLGVATIIFLTPLSPVLDPTDTFLFHLSGPTSAVLLPLGTDFILLWLLLFGLFLAARTAAKIDRLLWSALIQTLPWILLKDAASLSKWTLPHRLSQAVFLGCILAFVGLHVFWNTRVTVVFCRIERLTATVLAFAGVSGIFILVQLFGVAWRTRDLNAPTPLHQHAAPSRPTVTPHARVFWIVFDELSFQQLYERRYPGLRLDAFDSLAAQSTLFTQVLPAGPRTEIVLPALMTGFSIDRIRNSADQQRLSLHASSHNSHDDWEPFDPHQTIFQDALDRGYNTSVAGWYMPYCRLLAQVLDTCSWTFRSLAPAGIDPANALTANLLAPPRQLFTNIGYLFGPHGRPVLPQETSDHIRDEIQLATDADAILADPQATFVLLHMPFPHPFGIFDRSRMTLLAPDSTHTSSYIDNLALADQYLAHLRSTLEERGEWDSSTIVLMGDHSWRTVSWSSAPGWTPEDLAASRSPATGAIVFDPRPAYIVKLPNQSVPARIDQPFPAVRTRALLDVLLEHRITTPADLQIWADGKP